MADRDSFRGRLRPDYDHAVQHLQDCQAEDAAAQIGYAVIKDVRKTLRKNLAVWNEHCDVIAELQSMTPAERSGFVFQRLPSAPGKCSEVLRRAMLALTVTLQFRGETLSNARHALFHRWLVEIAEYEIVARLEITTQTGHERRTDCMVETIERVRVLLDHEFGRLTEECDAGEKDTKLKWPKPLPTVPDDERAGIQGIPVKMQRPKKGKGNG